MASNVIPIDHLQVTNCRKGRSYPMADALLGKHGLTPKHGVGLDYFSNAAARMGWGTPSLTEATEYDLVRLSYNYWLLITLYRNHWISRRIVDTPAQDMVRAWPSLTSEVDPKDLSRIDRAIRDTGTKSDMLRTLKWARLFGGAGALIVIDGQENVLDEPLDLESIEIGAYRGIIPFDRWSGISPVGELGTDIRKPREFNLPQHYEIQTANGGGSFKVHASRILRFCGPGVPTPEYEAQQYWGISVLEPAYEEIRKRDNLSWNILSVSFRANLIAFQFKELAQALSGAGMSQAALVAFEQRMQVMNQLLSNQSMMILPEGGTLSSTQQNMAGWADVYQQFQLDIAGAATIPVTRLFGRTLTGLGQSNDADERIYEEAIALEQSDQMEPQLHKLYPVICMSVLGEIPKDLDLKFPSIRVPNEKEKAELSKAMTDSVVVAFGAGILNKSQSMKELKQSSDVTGIFTNITDEDIAEAEEQERIAPEAVGELDPDGMDPDEDLDKEEESEIERKPSEKPDKAARAANQHDSARFFDVTFAGLPITIEFQAGDRRTIRNAKGEVVYDRVLDHDYGFIKNTLGKDGDEVDVILGPDENASNVFVIAMIDMGPDVDQREDEDKVCVGFASIEEARAAFLSMYPANFLGEISKVSRQNFKTVLKSRTRLATYAHAARSRH